VKLIARLPTTYQKPYAEWDWKARVPITAPTWCVAYAKQPDKAKGTALKSYFKYMLTDAQALIKDIDFAPLPRSLADKAVAQLEKIQGP